LTSVALDEQGAPSGPRVASNAAISVLLVEDEDLVRAVARRVLEKHGMQVEEADCPAKALAIFCARPNAFDVVVSDVVMPGMSGPAMVEEMLPITPGLKVLFMSGYTNNALVLQVVAERGFMFLQKPFTPQELLSMVLELAAAAASVR
jgi:DNA-binding NtrC family response regulator